MRGMARAQNDDAALVEIKAVEPSWPRIGEAVFAPPMPLDQALSVKDGVFGAAVEEALLARLNLKIGDVIRIGDAKFALRTVLVSEPDRLATGIGLGPRVLISLARARRNRAGPARIAGALDDPRVDGRAGGAPDEAAVKALIDAANKAFPASRLGGARPRQRLAEFSKTSIASPNSSR